MIVPILTMLLAAADGGGDNIGWWVGVLGAAGGILTILTKFLLDWAKARDEARQSARKAEAEDKDKQITRLLVELDSVKASLAAEMAAGHARRRDLAESKGLNTTYYGTLGRWHGMMGRLIKLARDGGAVTEDQPEMPPPPPNGPDKAADARSQFIMAQHEQAARELNARAGELLAKPPEKGDGK